jgi:hypothetical protein
MLRSAVWGMWFLTARPPEYINKNIIKVVLLTVWGMWVVIVDLICLFMHLRSRCHFHHFLYCKTELVPSHKKLKIQNQNITKNSPRELHDFNTSDSHKKNVRLLNILNTKNQYNFVFYAWANNKTNNAWNYRSHHQEILWQLSASYENHTIQKLKQFYCKTKNKL